MFFLHLIVGVNLKCLVHLKIKQYFEKSQSATSWCEQYHMLDVCPVFRSPNLRWTLPALVFMNLRPISNLNVPSVLPKVFGLNLFKCTSRLGHWEELIRDISLSSSGIAKTGPLIEIVLCDVLSPLSFQYYFFLEAYFDNTVISVTSSCNKRISMCEILRWQLIDGSTGYAIRVAVSQSAV